MESQVISRLKIELIEFQFGHGGEPWSHPDVGGSEFAGILFQFGHGGEPWSHGGTNMEEEMLILVSIRPRR